MEVREAMEKMEAQTNLEDLIELLSKWGPNGERDAEYAKVIYTYVTKELPIQRESQTSSRVKVIGWILVRFLPEFEKLRKYTYEFTAQDLSEWIVDMFKTKNPLESFVNCFKDKLEPEQFRSGQGLIEHILIGKGYRADK